MAAADPREGEEGGGVHGRPGRLHSRPVRIRIRRGTTGDARIRDITQALPSQFAEQLFSAREQGAKEDQLRQIAADGLARMYFRADNSRAHGLGVEFTDVERLEIEL
ncbi:telomere-protecting terminal protein Tpg [Streptomyces sp. NPDC091265]|uniref:telomere-protecting terminal protein Tpg n=1 Tax=unclassified Streptomyces TaxID=2593676 RepID=UPI00344F3C96